MMLTWIGKKNPNSVKVTKKKYKVLKDDAKSRQEIELHWRAATCNNVVNIRYFVLQLSTINNYLQLKLPSFAYYQHQLFVFAIIHN